MKTARQNNAPRAWLAWTFSSAIAASACSSVPDAEATSGGASSDAVAAGGAPGTSTGVGGEGGGGPITAPPECTSPSGYQVCGGLNHCPYDESSWCPDCVVFPEPKKQGDVAVCANELYWQHFKGSPLGVAGCGYCLDGDACIDLFSIGQTSHCLPFELAVLVDENGGASRLRYADYSLWTGEPLPTPATCPKLSDDVPLCGAGCDPCPSSHPCTGRSPLHPWGLCIPNHELDDYYCNTEDPCEPGKGCFHWKVQPEAQGEADQGGYCLPLAACKAAASELPGGGFCVEPP